MRIPKSFQMGPHTWRVHFVTEDEMAERAGDDQTEGFTDFQNCEVLLLRNGRTRSYVEHTFCHELMHILAKSAGLSKLCDDEGNIDALGGLLAQAWQTMK